jgi:AcrR family transcriptional regulator
MGITERREREKAERRRTILDCARQFILRQGVEQLRMEEIARKAELSKATVYLYFPSKHLLLSEICDEAARVFWEHLQPYLKTSLSGLDALKSFWRGYLEVVGSADDMIIVFKVSKFLNFWPPVSLSKNQNASLYTDAIIDAMKNIIDRCKDEGIFDPRLDSALATRLLLSVFTVIMEKAAFSLADTPQDRISAAVVDEMAHAFQIIVRGFAKEGIARSRLDITN